MGYFLVKSQYEAIAENGKQGKVTRLSLVDGITFGEVEERTHEELKPYISGEIFIADIRRYSIQDLINNSGDIFYRIQVIYTVLDEKSGKEKETKHYYLVSSDNMEDAQKQLSEYMVGTLGDWTIGKIEATKIMDIWV